MTAWAVWAVAALVAWGGFAFGAVYPWAFTPLFIASAALGVMLLARKRGGSDVWLLGVMLLAVLAAISVQLIPLDPATIARISPETDVLLRQIRLGYPDALGRHPLSINPPATLHGLAAAAALSVLLLGLMAGLTRDDAAGIVRAVAVLGLVMSVAGVVQHALWNGKIYGFWTPIFKATSFGPFVNRNHFAGWMLMALPLVFAYFCGRISKAMRAVAPGWRHRLMWLSSGDATGTVLVGLAAFVMAVALAMTQSRSGLLGLVALGGLAVFLAFRGPGSPARRLMVVGVFALLIATVVGGIGMERLTRRLGDPDLSTLGNRAGVWRDTWNIGARFPIAGTGLNTYGDAMLVFQTVDPDVHYNEAHNDYLQLFAEGGFLVTIPALAAVAVFWGIVRRRFRQVPAESSDYWIRVGAVTGILAVALQSLADFSLQMPGNAVLFVVLMALAARHSSLTREHA